MALAYEVAEELFNAGRFVELVRKASGSPHDAAHLPGSPLRVLVAHAVFYLGHLSLAKLLVENNRVQSAHARAEIVLGLVDKRSGDFESASRHFHDAMQAAKQSEDETMLAWAQLHLFRLLL